MRNDERSIDLLKALSEESGVSGYEMPIRNLLTEYLRPLSDELLEDHLGSLAAKIAGREQELKIMLAAHMDEVGLMVTKITDEGFIKFLKLGGWWDPVLLNQKVQIYNSARTVTGIIGAKAPHILTAEEKKQPVTINSLFIDIGAGSKDEVEALGIRSGDPVVPFSTFEMCESFRCFRGKALDDRIGCSMLIEIFRELHATPVPGTVYGVMTVQEEVGIRGAGTSVSVVKPDLAIVLDVTVATDTPNISPGDVVSKTALGKGPVICFYDASMIPHIPFRDFVVNTAEENQIPYQIELMPGGGTDAGKIHLYRQGVPSIVIGVPVRYIHDHYGIANLDDYHNALKLVLALLNQIDSETFRAIISNHSDGNL
ncbi:MAG: ysdC [Bacillota bacterium]|jgi:endoglucanase|nr:ysdC [Bacillota bacterium]